MANFQVSWSIRLSQQPLLYTLAKLPDPSIVYQSSSQHLLVHSHNQSKTLPIRKQLLGLQSFIDNNPSSINKGMSFILLLTRYQLSCQDFLNNNQIFKIEFQNAQKIYLENQIIYVVCGSDLHSYSLQGQQLFVNHLSCNIECVLPCQNGIVIVSMNDTTMIQYKGVNISFDYGKVIGVITCMAWMGSGVMVGSQQGTIAYYQSKKSKWKAKSTHKPICILNHKSNSQKSLAIVGRQSGLIQFRDWTNGSTINKVKLGQNLIGIKVFDYRQQGYNQLVCLGKSGEVKGYRQIDNVVPIRQGHQLHPQIKQMQIDIENLVQKRANLQFQINQLKELMSQQPTNQGPIINQNFQLTAILQYQKGLKLKIVCENGYISGLSFEESILPYQVEKSTKLIYTFINQNKIAGQINCQALVHANYSTKIYQVKKFKINLIKFWKWGYDPTVRKQINNNVKFKLNQRNARYLKWMKDCFLMNITQQQINKLQAAQTMKLRFYNWYQDLQMELIVISKQARFQIWCDCLKTMGDLIQDLVQYIGIKNLDSELSFPKHKDSIKDMLTMIAKLSQTKVSISSQMAEAINNIKFLLVKGQNGRLVGSMNQMRKSYGQIMEQNRNLITEVEKKNQNTKQLAQTLKNLGLMINQTSNVRYGQSKTKVVNQCRQAIKNKDFPRIISLMERGASG